MDKWEYKTISANLLQDSELNKLGQQGWEMAGMSDSSNGSRIAVMKRKLPSSPTQAVQKTKPVQTPNINDDFGITF
ncbi:hypothetical protein [uncultured Treponema sp.]|uniref:hypothetical protein n=1 Tax=uncultured Treponema sp. TaxID=162155 RepID=UPI0025933DBE|nr:hypothetical protein [uncultured Treponema sp.]